MGLLRLRVIAAALAAGAGQYRQADAAKRYRENKPRYDAILAKEEPGAAGTTPVEDKPGK